MKMKIKDKFYRFKTRSPFKKWVICSTLVFIAIICVNRKYNLFRWIEAGFTLEKQKNQIELYVNQNKELDKKINSLSTDRDSLETFARENFNFAAPGEDVYIVEE